LGPRINRPVRNNWLGTKVIGNYGEDFWVRSSANLIGIWANNTHEVICVVTKNHDGSLTLVLAPET
jgi:hypothetical protein